MNFDIMIFQMSNSIKKTFECSHPLTSVLLIIFPHYGKYISLHKLTLPHRIVCTHQSAPTHTWPNQNPKSHTHSIQRTNLVILLEAQCCWSFFSLVFIKVFINQNVFLSVFCLKWFLPEFVQFSSVSSGTVVVDMSTEEE